MATSESIIAVCGLDCTGCPLRTADTDAEAAGHLVGWFKAEGWLKEDEGVPELMQRGPYCRGCRGDRSVHWSAECWILQCCVDDKGLTFCYECDVFPCERLSEWAAENEGYTEALNRLRRMKGKLTD
jgi:hypothetical protein